MVLHLFQNLDLRQVQINEVAELLYEQSPFKNFSYNRLKSDFIDFLNNINYNLRKHHEIKDNYILGVVSYQFLVPLLKLELDIKEQKTKFCDFIQQKYGLEDPLDIRFKRNPERDKGLETIVCEIETHPLFKHKIPKNLKYGIYKQTLDEIHKLNKKYTKKQHLIAIAHAFVLAPAFEIHPKSSFSVYYEEAIKDHDDYYLLIPEEITNTDR